MQVFKWFVASLSVLFTLAVTSLISASEAGTLPGPGGVGFPPKPPMDVGRPPMPQNGVPTRRIAKAKLVVSIFSFIGDRPQKFIFVVEI